MNMWWAKKGTHAATGVGRGAKSACERRVHKMYTSGPREEATTAKTSGRMSVWALGFCVGVASCGVRAPQEPHGEAVVGGPHGIPFSLFWGAHTLYVGMSSPASLRGLNAQPHARNFGLAAAPASAAAGNQQNLGPRFAGGGWSQNAPGFTLIFGGSAYTVHSPSAYSGGGGGPGFTYQAQLQCSLAEALQRYVSALKTLESSVGQTPDTNENQSPSSSGKTLSEQLEDSLAQVTGAFSSSGTGESCRTVQALDCLTSTLVGFSDSSNAAAQASVTLSEQMLSCLKR